MIDTQDTILKITAILEVGKGTDYEKKQMVIDCSNSSYVLTEEDQARENLKGASLLLIGYLNEMSKASIKHDESNYLLAKTKAGEMLTAITELSKELCVKKADFANWKTTK